MTSLVASSAITFLRFNSHLPEEATTTTGNRGLFSYSRIKLVLGLANMDAASPEPPTKIDPYKTLNIPNKATAAEVKTAYKKLALKHHPGECSYETF